MSARAFRLVQFRDANAAVGAAARLMAAHPAFAGRPLGPWLGVLEGQVRRGHQCFVVEGGDRVVGFLGFGFIAEAVGDRWVAGGPAPTFDECAGGDCLLVNAWVAPDPAVHRFLWREAFRPLARGRRAAFGRRFYPDGRARPARLALPGARAPAPALADELP